MKSKSKEPKIAKKPKAKQPYAALNTKSKLLFLGIFTALSFILYFQAISYGYVLDDKLVYSENSFTKEGIKGIKKIMTTESFQGYFGEQMNLVQGARYRPLSLVTFNLEHQVAGLSPALSHFLNILFYALAGFICFVTLRRLFQENSDGKKALLGIAFLSSVIFLFHPIHVEAVANVKGRDEIMSFAFSMLALWSGLKFADSKKLKWLVFISMFYLLGILSKENTITFWAIIPAAILLFRKNAKATTAKIFLALTLSTIAYLAYRNNIIGYLLGGAMSNDLMNNSFVGMTGSEKYATIFYTLLEYLRLNVFPHPLTHDYYPYHIPKMDFGDWQVWLSLILHISLVIVMLVTYRKRKKLSFGIFYYITAMSIVSNLVFNIGTFMNERFAFAASLGVCLIMAYLIKLVSKKAKGKAQQTTALLAGVILLFYGIKTLTRVPVWESELTLNKAAIKVSTNSARANSFMATALFNKYKDLTDVTEKRKLLDEAEPYAIKAVEIHPSYYNGHLMRCGIAAEKYKYDKNLDHLLSEFKAVMLHRPDVDFLKTYLEYLNGRANKDKLMAFYKDICIKEMMEKQRNYSWAIHYLKLAASLDRNDEEIKMAMRNAYNASGQRSN